MNGRSGKEGGGEREEESGIKGGEEGSGRDGGGNKREERERGKREGRGREEDRS